MMVRVKMCGFTRASDIAFASKIGVDAIGLVFYEQSPRQVTITRAIDICRHLSPFVTKVGLFVNASKDEIDNVLSNIKLDCLQFHGDETYEFCEQYKMPYIKAVRIGANNYEKTIDDFTNANAKKDTNLSGFLIDTYSTANYGGTGKTFDWQFYWPEIIKLAKGYPLILAGGLDCDNIERAISITKPYAVDVSGGIEVGKSEKGIKDSAKMLSFMNKVHIQNQKL